MLDIIPPTFPLQDPDLEPLGHLLTVQHEKLNCKCLRNKQDYLSCVGFIRGSAIADTLNRPHRGMGRV